MQTPAIGMVPGQARDKKALFMADMPGLRLNRGGGGQGVCFILPHPPAESADEYLALPLAGPFRCGQPLSIALAESCFRQY